jgi:CRP-like cAMP-binding protein
MNDLRRYISTLTHFSDHSWSIFESCLSAQEFKRHETLLQEGQICRAVFFIRTGLCRSSYNLDGKEVNLAFYREQEFATNVKSLTTGTPSEYNIKAYEKTKVIRLDKVKLLEAYNESQEIATFGRIVLEFIMTKQEEHSASFKLLPPKQRFEQFVLQYPELMQRIPLTQIASYLGISRETLSRIRASQ